MDEERVQNVIKNLNLKVAALEQQQKELTQSLLNVESLAGKRIAFSYCVDITIDTGATTIQEDTVQVSRAGPFFAERIICAFRIKTMQDSGEADWTGRYMPLSSRWIYPWIWPRNAGIGTIAQWNPLDFEWTYEVDDDDRQRTDKFLPGDILDREDNDGIFAVSDLFAAGATIRFKVSPLRAVGGVAPWVSGTTGVEDWEFNAVFWGYKLIQPIQV